LHVDLSAKYEADEAKRREEEATEVEHARVSGISDEDIAEALGVGTREGTRTGQAAGAAQGVGDIAGELAGQGDAAEPESGIGGANSGEVGYFDFGANEKPATPPGHQPKSKAAIDAIIKSGGREVFRGFPDPTHAAVMRAGQSFTGQGDYGNGVYVSTD